MKTKRNASERRGPLPQLLPACLQQSGYVVIYTASCRYVNRYYVHGNAKKDVNSGHAVAATARQFYILATDFSVN